MDEKKTTLRDVLPLVREAVAASEAAGDAVAVASIRPTPETLAMWGKGPRLVCHRCQKPHPEMMRGPEGIVCASCARGCQCPPRPALTGFGAGSATEDRLTEKHTREHGHHANYNGGAGVRNGCWQCDETLGTGPEKCLTCAAKRAEDRAKESGR